MSSPLTHCHANTYAFPSLSGCYGIFPAPLHCLVPMAVTTANAWRIPVFNALHFLRLAKPLTMQGSGKCLANAWRLTCPPAFVLSSPDSRSASLDAYTVQANAWRMARSVPSHSLRLCWIISWYVTLRTPRLVAKQRRRSGAMGRNIPRSFSPGATPKPDHPFKARAYLCSGVFHRRGFWAIYYNALDRKHNPVV